MKTAIGRQVTTGSTIILAVFMSLFLACGHADPARRPLYGVFYFGCLFFALLLWWLASFRDAQAQADADELAKGRDFWKTEAQSLVKKYGDANAQVAALTCARNELQAASADVTAERDAAVAKLLRISEVIEVD